MLAVIYCGVIVLLVQPNQTYNRTNFPWAAIMEHSLQGRLRFVTQIRKIQKGPFEEERGASIWSDDNPLWKSILHWQFLYKLPFIMNYTVQLLKQNTNEKQIFISMLPDFQCCCLASKCLKQLWGKFKLHTHTQKPTCHMKQTIFIHIHIFNFFINADF